jgi:PAT family beta-lactamase induction signal transducer AmpG
MTRRIMLAWIAVLYFVEGLPFGIFDGAMPVYLRMRGVALSDIGLISLLQFPWTVKVLWSPIVDRLGTPKRWIMGALLAVGAALAGLAAIDATGKLVGLSAVLLALAVASATQDVAIDGFFVRFVPDGEEGVSNGVRVSAYRAAMIVGGGGSVMLAAWTAWSSIFVVLAGLCLVLAVVMVRAPEVPTASHAEPLSAWFRSLMDWAREPGALGVFLFIVLYKLGDASMGAMVKPFWVDRGMTPEEIGAINTTVGIGTTVLGALVGGWYTTSRGIFRALWVLGLGQAFSNLGYAAVAALDLGRVGLYCASVVESFTQGLGTASLLAFLTRICDRRHAATQYAALSAMFGLTRIIAGAVGGFLAERAGFAVFFALTFVMSFPAYLLLPQVRARLSRPESRVAAA